ncbi:flavodoxin family protein [Clostridium sp. SHJSY1]|uniref:flavodoxin family protein n=1 Tax=Clostridium sp. SHJSY1 TaxID=2942483 RepID=UPI0028755BA8|nr:flavodoxin family protein [Clostridium sp. SHJSY1]MDS0524242.1 flavodoxin family protein [Clostridium sp. SHJSY1]
MENKWIAVVGSPRKGKNTDLIVDFVIEGLEQKNIEVDKFYLDSDNISTCRGCEYCISIGNCIIEDDITNIIDRMKDADGYILASPSYNYNMTAQMKSLLDRTFCLNDYSNGWKSRLAPNKKAIIVGVCAGKTKESMGYTIEGMIKPISELGVKVVEVIEYYNTKEKSVKNNDNIRKEITKKIKDIDL